MMQDPEQPPLADPEKVQVLPQRNGHWIALLLPIHAAFAWAFGARESVRGKPVEP